MDRLPVEVHSVIAQQVSYTHQSNYHVFYTDGTGKVSSRHDLASLRRVSRYWRDVASPVFLECWFIDTDDGWMWWLYEKRPYQLSEEMSQLVRHFKVFANFHSNLEHRCLHHVYCSGQGTDEDGEDMDKDCVQLAGEELRPLLIQLKRNALRSFS